MEMTADKVMREQLIALLRGGNAHMSFADAVSGFPLKEINRRPPNASYTIWHLLEHMRIAQWDILEFMRNPNYVSPEFPAGYWPKADEMATTAQWKKTIKEFNTNLKEIEALVSNQKTDLLDPIPHAKDYSIFREILLVADHNAYHVSEIVAIRRLLNLNPIKEY
jgi:hypothetical protein